ncbi:MAG: hypothetical protein MMC33_005829 [Icmadophila ericetorum]|nr:hypothetical protein [Icmadophila ericetorum]
MSKKRTLDNFFQSSTPKKPRLQSVGNGEPKQNRNTESSKIVAYSTHPTYPYKIPHFPSYVSDALTEIPASEGKEIKDRPDLDFTTVFGVDETSRFTPDGTLIDAQTSKLIPKEKYPTCQPRPIPHCLDELRKITEVFTSSTYNFCLVNYYASGNDSVSYHSDDEQFLGPNPSIASFSLGAKRDFLMKHKPPKNAPPTPGLERPLKLALASGDMVLMRGPTQSNWLHSIPKRKGGESDKGRINITFRKAMVKYGTENYYRYNVGNGGVWRWDSKSKEMKPWGPK